MTAQSRIRFAPWAGLGAVAVLVCLAIGLPRWTGWAVHVRSFPPIHADWMPRVGPGSLPAVLVAAAALVYAPRVMEWRWRSLLVTCWLVSLAWLLSLALVDGWAGIDTILQTKSEYLQTARSVTNLHATLQEYVERIPFSYPDNWPVHIAGHPPGALLFFYLLVQVGLGTGLAAGLVVIAIASTTPLAVLVTLRTLGSERFARRSAAFLVLSPAAIWAGVSADGMFAAVAAWGLAALALGAARRSLIWSVVAGLLLGYCVMMSYGLPLLAILAIAVLICARSSYPLIPATVAAVVVVLVFAALGFSLWEAYPVLRVRYLHGIARKRPNGYWLWGDLAALCFSAGPLIGAGAAALAARGRGLLRSEQARTVVLLAGAAWLSILVADASLMSKAEVERIWLPFVPWLLLSCALLPERWRRGGLVLQVVAALAIQHLFATGW